MRHLLNVESGLNDGLVLPIVIVLLRLASQSEVNWISLGGEVALGIAIGVAIPWIAVLIERAGGLGVTASYEAFDGFAIGLAVFATASVLHANEYLAAFAAGVTVASVGSDVKERFGEFVERVTELLKLAALLVFGALALLILRSGAVDGDRMFHTIALVLPRPRASHPSDVRESRRVARLTTSRAAWRRRSPEGDLHPPRQEEYRMLNHLKRQTAVIAGAVLLACAAMAHADEWNERTTLKFSEAVMVPGATLQPGTYVFELADSTSARHVVRIRNESGELVATAQAVPAKRPDPNGDIVLKFNPTDRGTPPALKTWFYPGSLYGHQFVYSDAEARQIAQRTKTVVLSTDVPGTDLEKGTLHTYDQSGRATAWKGDDATMREWDEWQRARQGRAAVHQSGSSDDRSSTPMVRGDFQTTRVKLDDLEDNPMKYVGQKISVDGEVEEVFGPRLFTIDEANWGDLSGEMLVFVPSPLAALVQDDDRVTVTGTVKRFVQAEVVNEWGWLGLDADTEVELGMRPMLVADRVVGGNDHVAMVIDTGDAAKPVGTSGSSATGASAASAHGNAITSLDQIAHGDEDLVGRRVMLSNIHVARQADRGFFAGGTKPSVYVLPADAGQAIADGASLSLDGVVLQMPRGVRDRLIVPAQANDDIYVYATKIQR